MCLEVLLLCVHLVLGGLDSRVEAEFNGRLILNTMNVTQTCLYVLDHITDCQIPKLEKKLSKQCVIYLMCCKMGWRVVF